MDKESLDFPISTEHLQKVVGWLKEKKGHTVNPSIPLQRKIPTSFKGLGFFAAFVGRKKIGQRGGAAKNEVADFILSPSATYLHLV